MITEKIPYTVYGNSFDTLYEKNIVLFSLPTWQGEEQESANPIVREQEKFVCLIFRQRRSWVSERFRMPIVRAGERLS